MLPDTADDPDVQEVEGSDWRSRPGPKRAEDFSQQHWPHPGIFICLPDPLRDICPNAKRPLLRYLSPERTAQLVHLRAASEGQGQPPSLRAELPGRQVSDGPIPSPKLPPRVRPQHVPGLQLVTEDQDTHGCLAASERSQACGEARGVGGDLVEHRLRREHAEGPALRGGQPKGPIRRGGPQQVMRGFRQVPPGPWEAQAHGGRTT